MKSIANSAPVSATEVRDIVCQPIQDNATKCLQRIMKLYTQSHLYLAHWKALRIDLECLKRNIGLVRRFEASGLQLEGKGLWLLSMILEYTCDPVIMDESTLTVLFDTLLRIAVESTSTSACTAMLLLLVQKFNASCNHLFQTGCTIADHLPASIAADNFIAILDFALVCIDLDPACSLGACKFLVALAANVSPNHKANYFLRKVVTHLGGVLQSLKDERKTSNSTGTEKQPVNGQEQGVDSGIDANCNSSSDKTGSTEAEEHREQEVFIFVLLTYLVPLHPEHAQIIMRQRQPLHLPSHAVERLRRGKLSEAGECAALLFLDSLCIDTTAKDELKAVISVDLMRSKMSIYCPTVTEKATKLFLSLFAEDIECNYRPRSSVDLRGHSGSFRLPSHSPQTTRSASYRPHSPTPGADAAGGGDGDGGDGTEGAEQSSRHSSSAIATALLEASAANSAQVGMNRSDCSWSIDGVTCLRDLLDIVLTITEAALRDGTVTGGDSTQGGEGQGQSPDQLQQRMLHERSNGWGRKSDLYAYTAAGMAESETATKSHTGVAFHYLNSVVYHIGLCVEIHRICSLHDVVAKIVALVLDEFKDMSTFDLSNAKIIDTLFLLIGVRERCWQPHRADTIDADYLNLSSALVDHFMSLADPLLTDASDDRTLPVVPAATSNSSSTGNLLNARVVSHAKERFLRDASFLQNFVEDWEVESTESICQKLLLLYCRLQLGGIDALRSVVELEPLEEMLWDMLSDERHGLDEYPEMRRKCIQLFTAIGIHLQRGPGVGVGVGGSPPPSPNTPASINGAANPGSTVSANGSQKDTPAPEPVELAHAAPLAELALRLLTTQESVGGVADEDDDDFDIPGLQLPGVLAGGGGGSSTTTQLKARSATRTDGGKCVSRIFRTRKHILQLRYSSLSAVMHICETTRTVRRKVISNYAEIVRNFSHLDPVKSMVPLLQLVALAAEYLTKVESAGEEAIVTLLVRCLRFHDAEVRTLACEVIAVIGGASPGLLHRGICRPEIEDLLIDILQSSCAEEEPQQHSGPLVRAVLKACNALTHDINIKPGWIPTPFTYHWSRYTSDIANRPLFVPAFLDTLQLVVRRASRTYVIQYCALVLSIVTCLMYACNDGVFSARSGDTHIIDLKAALLQKFLPWMPVILDYLTSHRKIIRSLMASNASSPVAISLPPGPSLKVLPTIHEGGSDKTSTSPSQAPTPQVKGNSAGNPAGNPSSKAFADVSTAALATYSDKDGSLGSSAGGSESSSRDNSSKSGGLGSFLNRVSVRRRSSGGSSGLTEAASAATNASTVSNSVNGANAPPVSPPVPERRPEVRYSPSAENLAEKLIEAMHAFLCMDEMFPLSTYLQNATMFNGTPVIACVSYFMTECRTNLKVQRRGIDFLRHFADNQIGLSSIAMHSPSAILHAARLLSDTLEVQYSFCRIVSSVARSDEFARENFIRFNVQSWLAELIHRQHPEQSRLACIAASDLCVTPCDTISVLQGSGVIEAVLALLDALPNDFKVQVEGVRVLVVADQAPELLAPVRKVSAAQVLKKTKKFLTAAAKQESFPDGYERADVENLLASTLWAKDPLLSKILGFFG